MLKMDFLGLKTLTIIVDAMNLIERNHGVKIDIDDIPLDDEKTYALYQRGDTIGTFQFESEGMRQYLKDLKPTNIEDLIAMNALYRPGPMQFIPNFINRKHGREPVEYPHELLEPILNYSQGIMVYQEQIMQAAQILGGYSLGGADLLRRAMGKKDLKKMAQEREKFVAGCKSLHGIPAKKASEVFDVMEKFAAYGFNRSHSAAYSVVAYQTGYLKANYPAEYMAAVLTNNMGDIKKVTFFIEEARKQGVAVLGPDVNESLQKFNVNQQGKIRFGLAAVKGAGEAAVQELVEDREKNGPYLDVFDFAKRVNLRAVNKKTFESLAQAGAFDSFEKYHRRLFLDAPAGDSNLIEKAMKMGQQHQAAKESAQHSLFGAGAFGAVAAPLPKVPEMEPWTKTEQLRREKEVVGCYLSGHPLDAYKLEIDAYCTCALDKVETFKNREINLAGLITNVAMRTTKTGQPFVVFNLEDYDASLPLALFRDDYTTFAPLINPRNYPNEQVPAMFVRAKMELRRGTQDQWETRILNMQPLHEVADKMSRGVRVKLDLRTVTGPMIDRLEEAIQAAPGKKRLEIQFAEPHEHLAVDMFSRKFQIEPKTFIEKMSEMDMDVCVLI